MKVNRENNQKESNQKENYTINKDAQLLIEKSEKRALDFKHQILEEMLLAINEQCEKYDLHYFVMGKLLTYCVYQEDSYPEVNAYLIGMMREDYDVFMEKVAPILEGHGIQIKRQYDKIGLIGNLHTGIVKKGTLKDDLGVLETEVSIRIDSYEYLPDDKKECRHFMNSVVKKTRKYRADSRDYRGIYDGSKKFQNNISGKAKHLLKKLRMHNAFKKRYKEYRSYIHQFKDTNFVGRVELLCYGAQRKTDIFPLKKQEFLSTYVYMPNEWEVFCPAPKDKENENIAEQRIGALKEIDHICQEHHLNYFLLGALASGCTHYGDYKKGTERNDWKIGMPREDYNQFIHLLQEKSTSSILVLREEMEDYPLIHNKNCGVVLKKGRNYIHGEKEYRITVLPFDALPDDYEEGVQFIRNLKSKVEEYDQAVKREKGLFVDDPENLEDSSWKQFEELQEMMQTYNKKGISPDRIFAMDYKRAVMLPVVDVYPLERRDFHGISVLNPKNPFIWHEEKDEMYTEYMGQEKAKILKIIDRICRENDFPYFAIAKLLVGATVYQDLIPMSDDSNTEIALLRKDYEKFLIFLREHGEAYGIQLNEYRDKNQRIPMITKTITEVSNPFSKVKIPVLPFDKIPEDYYQFTGFREEMDAMNLNYQELLLYHSNGQQKLREKYTAKEYAEKEAWWKTADIVKEAEKINEFAQSYNEDDRVHSYGRCAFNKTRVIEERDLFPLIRVPFRDIEISCPKDYSVWQPIQDEELKRQVKCIQKADLFIMEEFDKICKKLNVGYFICGGTMLGYMRHEGFIPWDDDVDVAMLRADYDRFINEAGPLMPEGFFLQTRQTDPNIPYLFSKVRLDRTEYITKYNEKRDFHKGICLDIFPFDYIPDDMEERKAFLEEVNEKSRQHNFIANRQYPKPSEEDVVKPINALQEKYYEEQEKIRQNYWKKSLEDSQNEYLKVATRYNDRAEELGLHTVASFVPSYTFIDLNDLLPYQRGLFEGIEVSVPKRPDIFLTMQYGDYMQLPPKHNQVAHRLLRWSTWEASGDNTNR